ncbi:MAG: zinc ABC transporter substrate-binding protein [Spirochaetaceae bacterium]
MKRITYLILSVISIYSLFGTTNIEEESNSLKVFTSIIPQKFFVEQIGGERVDCSVLVGPGKNPATYQPTPNQIVKLSTADILFTIGVPFENIYLGKILNTLKNLKVIDSSIGIKKREIVEGHNHSVEEHPENEELDPHTWLSPVLGKIIAQNILINLIKSDPEGEEYYTSRFNILIKQLNSITEELHQILDPYKGNVVFVYHPSFGYFLDEFGLIQEAVETGGKEPTPKGLERIISEAIADGAKIIVVQPEFSIKSAKVIADAIGGRVTSLNPLHQDYLLNLKNIATEISKAYK